MLAIIIDATQRCHVMHHVGSTDLAADLHAAFDAWNRKFKPAAFALVFDAPNAREWRQQIWPAYKSHRPKDLDLEAKIEEARRSCADCGLPVFAVDGYEVDDVIGALVKRWTSVDGRKAVIASSDRDMVQFLNPGRVTLCTKFSCGAEFVGKFVTAAEWEQEQKVPMNRCVEYKMLVGDQSDNLTGLPGVGEVNARKIIASTPSLKKCLAAPSSLPKSSQPHWNGFFESLETLAQVVRARPVADELLDACCAEPWQYDPWRAAKA